MIKFSKLGFSTTICFVIGLICVMFNSIWTPMIYPALVFFTAGFVLLTIKLYFYVNKSIKDKELAKEELIMELSTSEDGEEYILKNNPDSKKYRRKMRREKFSAYLPFLGSCLMAILMLFLLIKFIFKF